MGNPCGLWQSSACRSVRGHQQSQGKQKKFISSQTALWKSCACDGEDEFPATFVPVESRGRCGLPWNVAGRCSCRSPGSGWVGSIQVNQKHENLWRDTSLTFVSHGNSHNLVLCFHKAVGVRDFSLLFITAQFYGENRTQFSQEGELVPSQFYSRLIFLLKFICAFVYGVNTLEPCQDCHLGLP